jgi:DDE superfamily endonuclease
MDDAKQLWASWQSLVVSFGTVFTRPGWVRFVQWTTGTVLCPEEHTITQILVAAGLEGRWRSMEAFAEYGAWDRAEVERTTIRLIEEEQPVAQWGHYRAVAVDDTKEHRTSAKVWGTCTLHESTARCPNRAETVRVHNWVVAGDLLPGKPWRFLPHSARLYCRAQQLPPGETFRKKTELAVDLLQQQNAVSAAPLIAVFDGAYANETVVQPCLQPPAGGRRIEVVTRLRFDARLYAPVVKTPGANGRPRKWGRRLPAPQHHEQWQVPWRKSQALIYGRVRKLRYRQLACRWVVSGPAEAVQAFVFLVEGYDDPWYLITTALDLTAEQVVVLFAARFRQEDAFRDLKQRLGMEECRAWTKEPILRTFQVQLLAMTLLRLLEDRVDAAWGEGSWWNVPEWNRHKKHPSVLDLRRLFWRHRHKVSQCLLALEEMEKLPSRPTGGQKTATRAA